MNCGPNGPRKQRLDRKMWYNTQVKQDQNGTGSGDRSGDDQGVLD